MSFFKKRTIIDDAQDFEIQYNIAKVVIFEYLDDWFKQIAKSPDYKTIFGETDLHTTIAAQVENYLLGRDVKFPVRPSTDSTGRLQRYYLI